MAKKSMLKEEKSQYLVWQDGDFDNTYDWMVANNPKQAIAQYYDMHMREGLSLNVVCTCVHQEFFTACEKKTVTVEIKPVKENNGH